MLPAQYYLEAISIFHNWIL